MPKNTYPFSFRITFCVGAPRSGTTLLASLLSEGQTAYPMLPECTFITQLIRQFHDTLYFSDAPRFAAYAKSKETLVQIFSPTINGFVESASSHFADIKASELILKDPELTIYLDMLPYFFETNFRTVCMVRDPREVVASLALVYRKKNQRTKIQELIKTVFNHYWRSHESTLTKSGNVHFVRFERIINRDEAEFVKLEQYLGYKIGRRGFGKVFFDFDRSDATHTKNYGKPIISLETDHLAKTLSWIERGKIEKTFSGYNIIYKWW